MIITRSPLRITIGGGGTDLPSYYKYHGGFLISAAIDKYVYITIHERFTNELVIKYSELEKVSKISDIKHPIIKEALDLLKINNMSLEITSMADIPSGTGLGSSGSFTTSLLRALHRHKKNLVSQAQIAEQACHIEIDRLKEPVGKQDQYIAAIGGITCFKFNKNGSVKYHPLDISKETLYNLEDNLIMFFTGFSRKASTILMDQDVKSKSKDADMINNLHYVKDLGIRSMKALEDGNLIKFGKLMDEHWQHKKKRSQGMSNSEIDKWYNIALKNGAVGGKLIGARGGGFLMFYAENKLKLRHVLTEMGLREVRFKFDFEGTKIISG